jgi:tight adherence protein B
VIIAPTLIYRWLRVRRRHTLVRQLPDVAAALAAALRAGLSLSHALEQVVKFQPRPSSQEFSLMLREHRLGIPLDRALWALAHRSETKDFHLLVSTLGIARDLGGGLAEALERFSSMLRRRLALEDRIRALTAQGRLQGVIMGALPILLGGVLMLMEPETMSLLFSEPAGWAVCALVVALEAVGFVLIRRIVNIEV